MNKKAFSLVLILLMIFSVVFISLGFLKVNAISINKNKQIQIESNPPKLPLVDPKIDETFITQEKVMVVIKLRDTTGIPINYKLSREVQKSIDNQRRDIFYSIMDQIKAGLSIQEYKEVLRFATGNGLYANISKEGLLRLSNDPRIRKIYKPIPHEPALYEARQLINANPVENNLGYTGKGKHVCVLDTGIDYTHGYLGNCTQSEFLDGNCTKVPDGYDFVSYDENPYDNIDGHGSHVAGAIISNHTNQRGIAPNARILAFRVGNLIEAALDMCYKNRTSFDIVAASMSLATYDDIYKFNDNCNSNYFSAVEEVKQLHDAKIAVVASSGNKAWTDGIGDPSCIKHVISVGAVYDQSQSGRHPADPLDYSNISPSKYGACYDADVQPDNLTCFTNRDGDYIPDLVAPGRSINSPDPTGNDDPNLPGIQKFKERTGTSMSAPMVSGAIAVLKEVNNDLTPDQIEVILKSTGKTVIRDGYKYKRIDLLAAVNATLENTPFEILNSSGKMVAWFGSFGGVVITGVLEQNSSYKSDNDDLFVVEYNSNEIMAIAQNGSMYIEGELRVYQDNIKPSSTSAGFGVYNSSGQLVISINETGDLALKGAFISEGVLP